MDIAKAREELILGKTIYDMRLRVVDYGRVSTEKDDQLHSLENQINYFSDMIEKVKNWTHVASYSDEGISGTQVFKREKFLKMIEDARLGKIDLILTKEVSRFARNTIDSINYTQVLLKYGVIVFFISDNINTIYPDSEFRLTLMASMAQDEVRKLSERVKFGIRRSIKDRKVGGGALYGYNKKNCKLTINEKEAPAVRMLFSLYSSGEYGFKKIGELLADNGYYTKREKIFSDVTLKKMLINPRYKGFYTANMSKIEDYKTHKKVIRPKSEWIIEKDNKGNIPAIVSEKLWDQANNIYNAKKKIYNKNVLNKEAYLTNRKYTSKIICKEHNTVFIRSASCKRKDNPVWQCNEYLRHGIKGCISPILLEKHLDRVFFKVLEGFVENKDDLRNDIVKDYSNLLKESTKKFNMKLNNRKLKEIERDKDRLFEMSLKKMITDEDFLKKNKILTNKLKKIDKSFNILKERKKLEKEITIILDIKNNLGKYFNLFIDKVLVSKIDNDRKHLKLELIYNFNKVNDEYEIDSKKKV